MSRLTVIGDCLLDRDVDGTVSRLAPDAPAPVLDEREVRSRPGGAGLAAILAAADGHQVTLVTALPDDDPGRTVRDLLERADVAVVDLGALGPAAEKIRLRADGHTLVRWDRGRRTTADDIGPWVDAATEAVGTADAVLVSCYGRGITSRPDVRLAIEATVADRPVVWDPHPRGAEPVAGVAVATPNRSETADFVTEVVGDGLEAVTRRAETLTRRWGARGCAVTLGAAGAMFTTGTGLPSLSPTDPVDGQDACGAGDRFASAVAGELARGALPSEAVTAAVAIAACFVAAGGAAAVRIDADRAPAGAEVADAASLARQVRARGGTIVATGGCFDLVHAGHLHVLQAAKALGDCLIVCMNSDRSVRRLKGEDRPIVSESDRAQLLQALSCVDAVTVFEEDTPERVLRELRPDVFAKGGDYDRTLIPEADVVAEWGGQVVTLPYLDARSTSKLIEDVRHREHH